jgi:phosphoglycerate dehydrogenase-like enzyme
VRNGRWTERSAVPSVGLRGKTVGSVGLGNIGAELFRLLEPFGLARKLAADPYANPAIAAQLGVQLVDLATVFRESDFVAVNCPLTDETRSLVNAERINLMKPTAYLINTARGPIVNQADLVTALQTNRIAGAGLDVFEVEPLPVDHALTRMDNVILTPHSLAWTDELYHDTGASACENILSVLRGETPQFTVNKAVFAQPGFQNKLARLGERWAA